MTEKVVSLERAARTLNVQVRTVYFYVKQGKLRAGTYGKRTGVLEEDLLRLAELRKIKKEKGLPFRINKITIAQIMARLTVLESQNATMMRILNIKHDALNLTDPEWRGLYQMAEICAAKGWSPHEEQMWADTLVRMRLDNLEEISRIVEDEYPWRPFYKLASAMYLKAFSKDLLDQFAAAKANMHTLAVAWSNLKGDTIKKLDVMIEREATPRKRFLNLLDSQKAPDAPQEPYNPFKQKT